MREGKDPASKIITLLIILIMLIVLLNAITAAP